MNVTRFSIQLWTDVLRYGGYIDSKIMMTQYYSLRKLSTRKFHEECLLLAVL